MSRKKRTQRCKEDSLTQLMEKIKQLLLYAGLTQEEFSMIGKNSSILNQQYIAAYSRVGAISFLLLICFSPLDVIIRRYRVLYFAEILMMLICWWFSQKTRKKKVYLKISVAMFYLSILSFGIILGTVLDQQEPASAFFVLMLILPTIVFVQPYKSILAIIAADMIFVLLCWEYKHGTIFHTDIFNAIEFGILSMILCCSTMKLKAERYLLEVQLQSAYQIDLLTGMKNRNSYEKNTKKHPPYDVDSVFCIYIDLNGLHELNNTYGHEAGDQMLKYVASQIQKQFGKENTYRIGGDEFVILGSDMTEEEVYQQMLQLENAIEKEGYHAAVGMGWTKNAELELAELIRQAEQRMYENKQEYYEKTGLVHR